MAGRQKRDKKTCKSCYAYYHSLGVVDSPCWNCRVPSEWSSATQENDSCRFCTECEDLPEHIVDGQPVGKVFDTCIQPDENGWWHLEVPSGADIGIQFCPYCGRKLEQKGGR